MLTSEIFFIHNFLSSRLDPVLLVLLISIDVGIITLLARSIQALKPHTSYHASTALLSGAATPAAYRLRACRLLFFVALVGLTGTLQAQDTYDFQPAGTQQGGVNTFSTTLPLSGIGITFEDITNGPGSTEMELRGTFKGERLSTGDRRVAPEYPPRVISDTPSTVIISFDQPVNNPVISGFSLSSGADIPNPVRAEVISINGGAGSTLDIKEIDDDNLQGCLDTDLGSSAREGVQWIEGCELNFTGQINAQNVSSFTLQFTGQETGTYYFWAGVAPALTHVKSASLNDGGDGVADAGDQITYTFALENTGDIPLNNPTIVDDGGFTGENAFPTISFDAGQSTGSATATEIPVGDTAVFTATYTLTQADVDAGEITNQASVSADELSSPVVSDTGTDAGGTTISNPLTTDSNSDGTTDNDPTVLTIPASPELTLLKSATLNTNGYCPAVAGDDITYTFTVENIGGGDATNVSPTRPRSTLPS